MGNNMEKGEDFTNVFAPVQRSTAGRLLMALAATLDLELHAINLSQAFIKVDWADLPEQQQQIFICPSQGWTEEPDTVYEVLRPLYGIPSPGSALHFTMDCG